MGIDASKGMVKRARRNARLVGLKNVIFKRSEAESIPFAEAHHRFSPLEFQILFEKCGLIEIEQTEHLESMVLFSKGRVT